MMTRNPAHVPATSAKNGLGRKLAALAGATGAVAAGTAEAVPYTATAGVAAAQNIPGFSFDTATTSATLGALLPPATTNTSNDWDLDGDGNPDFRLFNSSNTNFRAGLLQVVNSNKIVLPATINGEAYTFKNLATSSSVGPGAPLRSSNAFATFLGQPSSNFTLGQSGQFGFSFASGGSTYYGWGSIVPTGSPVGQGFTITEAYYQTTAGSGILVGQVPQVVPEPTGMVLLAIGSAGVMAWRSRRKQAE